MDNEVDNEPFEIEENLGLRILVAKGRRGYNIYSQFGEEDAGIVLTAMCIYEVLLEEITDIVDRILKSMMVSQYREEVRKNTQIVVMGW
jgi:hypothetical protein